jgi:hypothetical protein
MVGEALGAPAATGWPPSSTSTHSVPNKLPFWLGETIVARSEPHATAARLVIAVNEAIDIKRPM